jgi:hypothetical protein
VTSNADDGCGEAAFQASFCAAVKHFEVTVLADLNPLSPKDRRQVIVVRKNSFFFE